MYSGPAVECIICLDVDPSGALLQCDEGHVACKQCYEQWEQKCRSETGRATCAECKQPLAKEAVRCRAMERLIEQKAAAVRRQAEQADAAATQREVADAAAQAEADTRREVLAAVAEADTREAARDYAQAEVVAILAAAKEEANETMALTERLGENAGAQAQALAEAKEEANETTALAERLGVDLEAQAQALAKYKEGAARRREEDAKAMAVAKELGVDVEAQVQGLAKYKRRMQARMQADDGPATKRAAA